MSKWYGVDTDLSMYTPSDIRKPNAERPAADEVEEIAEHCVRLPALDARPAVEILRYDETGLPH